MITVALEEWNYKQWNCLFCGHQYREIDEILERHCQHVIYVIGDRSLLYRNSYFDHKAGIKQFGKNRKYWNKEPFESDGLEDLIEGVNIPNHIDIQIQSPNGIDHIGLADCKLSDLSNDELSRLYGLSIITEGQFKRELINRRPRNPIRFRV